MLSITIQDAQTNLAAILQKMQPGEAALITENGLILARIAKVEVEPAPRIAGSAKDKIVWIAPDFDEPLEEFKEYM